MALLTGHRETERGERELRLTMHRTSNMPTAAAAATVEAATVAAVIYCLFTLK